MSVLLDTNSYRNLVVPMTLLHGYQGTVLYLTCLGESVDDINPY